MRKVTAIGLAYHHTSQKGVHPSSDSAVMDHNECLADILSKLCILEVELHFPDNHNSSKG